MSVEKLSILPIDLCSSRCLSMAFLYHTMGLKQHGALVHLRQLTLEISVENISQFYLMFFLYEQVLVHGSGAARPSPMNFELVVRLRGDARRGRSAGHRDLDVDVRLAVRPGCRVRRRPRWRTLLRVDDRRRRETVVAARRRRHCAPAAELSGGCSVL